MKTMTIKTSQIIGKRPLGVLKGAAGSENYKNTVIAYICGDIPVLLCTDLTQDQWDRMCEGNLSPKERFELCVLEMM